MGQVESKLVPPRPKEVSSEKVLSLAQAKLDRVMAQKAKFNQTSQHHLAKLRESEDLTAGKQLGLAEVEDEYRAARSKRFSPTQSVAATVEPDSDPEPETDNMSQDGAPGNDLDHSAREADPQVRHDVSDGKRRCGSGFPSVDLVERGICTFSNMDICRVKGIVDSQVESLSEEAKNSCTLAASPRGGRRASSEARGTPWAQD